MKLHEVSVGLFERKELKKKCRRIFNRLVVEDPDFQASTDEIQNIGLVLGFIIFVLGALYGFLTVGIPAVFEFIADGHTEIGEKVFRVVNFLRENAAVISFVFTLVVFVLSYKKVSRWTFEASGTGFIWFSKSLQSNKNKTKLLRMLDIVAKWLQTQPNKVCAAHNFLFKQPAGELLPKKLTESLRELRHSNNLDALIVRRFAEKRYWPLYILSFFRPLERDVLRGRRSYWREARGLRNAIRVNLVFDVLNAELRDEIPGGELWRREYRTDYPRQISALFDTDDLHMRMKTGAPYYRWPAASHPSSEKETALYRIIMCLENPMRAPIDIISVDEIIDQFGNAVSTLYKENQPNKEEGKLEIERRVNQALDILQASDIYMYGKRSRQSLRPSADAGLDAEPILRNIVSGKVDNNGDSLPPHWQLRWDPNVIDWANTVDPDGALFRALAILVQAVDMASDKATKARLGRGDALIVDNLRCLICRREWLDDNLFDKTTVLDKIWGWIKKTTIFPDRWWLRGYYGFRHSRPARQAPGS